MTPVLYIHLTEGDRQFTLRKTVMDLSGKMTTLHVAVLKSKLDASLAEAYEYARENGIELKHDANRCTYPTDLDAITNAKRAVRSSKKQAKLDQQAAVDKARQDRRTAKEESLENGVWPFGKHEGKTFDSEPGYARWMVEHKSEFDKGSLLEYAVGVLERKFPKLLEKEPSVYSQGHRPEKEKTRITIKGKVIRTMRFSSDYGMSYWIFIKDETGVCIVAKGSWWADEGTEVNITAAIKSKETYKGQDQTVVNRVK